MSWKHFPAPLLRSRTCAGDVGRPVLPHVGRHVGLHVAEGVEGAHGELEEEAAKHGQAASRQGRYLDPQHLGWTEKNNLLPWQVNAEIQI